MVPGQAPHLRLDTQSEMSEYHWCPGVLILTLASVLRVYTCPAAQCSVLGGHVAPLIPWWVHSKTLPEIRKPKRPIYWGCWIRWIIPCTGDMARPTTNIL